MLCENCGCRPGVFGTGQGVRMRARVAGCMGIRGKRGYLSCINFIMGFNLCMKSHCQTCSEVSKYKWKNKLINKLLYIYAVTRLEKILKLFYFMYFLYLS